MIEGPDSKYMMQHGGKWRAVVNMFDGALKQTTSMIHAKTAVLYVGGDSPYVACDVTPFDLFERDDRDPTARHWEEQV